MFAPSGSDVHAWVARLCDIGLDRDAAVAMLSDDERGRLARFHSPLHRERYALAHAFVRVLLASYLDVEPKRLTLERRSGGKPFLADDRSLFFNLSHSGDVVAVAITRVGEVGIDIEVERDVPNALSIARALMPAPELASFELLSGVERSRVLLEWWTRREAVGKASGVGIVDLALSDTCAGWAFDQMSAQLTTWDDCIAAIALTAPINRLRVETIRVTPAAVALAPTRPEYERSAKGTVGPKLDRRP